MLAFFAGVFFHSAVIAFTRGEHRRGWLEVAKMLGYLGILGYITLRDLRP